VAVRTVERQALTLVARATSDVAQPVIFTERLTGPAGADGEPDHVWRVITELLLTAARSEHLGVDDPSYLARTAGSPRLHERPAAR